ncbi:DIP1984 family protein [Vagococcus sp. PNs007]|uniref:DIP1984 family protein n=1 Tax=Vagococcus proximus TaxID=2991417 RepID=A0ABT5X2V1_9ENTE|nr:DIP1984 family protein [Vagococcus proximus]MDF0480338.1 DIP1984 family protein [Vagococcus proximus]
MKLAEALLLRAEYQTKLENLENRLLSNLKIQEGDSPNEDPIVLLSEMEATNRKLTELVKKINTCNAREKLSDGRPLSDALVDREALLKERRILATLVGRANEQDYRVSRTEIKMTVTLSVKELQSRIDSLSKEYRQLDTELQGKNWTVDL